MWSLYAPKYWICIHFVHLYAYTNLGVLWIEKGPRSSTRASQEHAGHFAVHTKRYVATNTKNIKLQEKFPQQMCKTTHRVLVYAVVYQTRAFSGMFMMWSSVSSLGFCCCGSQDLTEVAKGAVPIFKNCFSCAFSYLSTQSREPGLVPVRPQILTCHHSAFITYKTIKALDWKCIKMY